MNREEAIKKLQKQKAEYLEELVDYSGVAEAYDMAIEALSQPIVAKHFDIQSGYIYCSPQDAENVEVVVRCKDCKYYDPNGLCDKNSGFCENHDHDIGDDDFCSWGEKKQA